MEDIRRLLSNWDIDITDDQINRFESYFDLLIEWNSKMNLTAITQKEDVIIKHFVDSLALCKFHDLSGKKLLDVGTGAGFPGVPLKIMCPDCEIVLLDSLNKRLVFLDTVISELALSGITTVHGRAEDTAHNNKYRERFDIVTSRAVANLSTLSEYCLPFVNINGYFISYKGGNVTSEINDSEPAIKKLGGFLEITEEFSLPESDNERSLIFIKKVDHTPNRFPRKAGTPSKDPII